MFLLLYLSISCIITKGKEIVCSKEIQQGTGEKAQQLRVSSFRRPGFISYYIHGSS